MIWLSGRRYCLGEMRERVHVGGEDRFLSLSVEIIRNRSLFFIFKQSLVDLRMIFKQGLGG